MVMAGFSLFFLLIRPAHGSSLLEFQAAAEGSLSGVEAIPTIRLIIMVLWEAAAAGALRFAPSCRGSDPAVWSRRISQFSLACE